jgi:outer membrane protein OmpA-like peptidoglycan-associated protein
MSNAVKTRHNALFSALLLAMSLPVAAQHTQAANNNEVTPTDSLNMTFAGDQTRLGIGINDNGDVVAEILKSFASDWRSNWMGEAWYADGAGGLKLNYHWLRGAKDQNQLTENADRLSVWKVFAAVDQNTFDDRKLTLGAGAERNNRFWSVSLSKGLTDARLTDRLTEIQNSIINGSVGNHPTEQTQTIETTTFWYEQAYDLGVGGRIGRFFDQSLLRVSAGIDYEKGDYSSKQWTASLNLEKYFRNTGHSLALSVEQLHKSGDYQTSDSNDTRAVLMYRYDFGTTYRPTQRFEKVKTVDEVALAQLKEERRQVMQNQVNLSSRTFFDLDSAVLKPESKALLTDVANKIKRLKLASKITVVGHTCDLGTEQYNQGLSERRAAAARQYLISQGIPAEQIVTYGKGESEPLEPNIDEAHRRKNRRVEISFLTIEKKVKDVEIPADEVPVKWVKKPVQAPPAWIDRALRNPIKHKRSVDTYRFRKVDVKTTLGEVVVLNEAPQAADDSISFNHADGSVVIPVLSNDSDPEGDGLTIIDVSQPANGTVVNNGDSLSYTPNPGFVGTDTFTYTIDDGHGGQTTATVTVEVTNQAPAAVDDGPYILMTNAPHVLDVLANDTDPDGDAISIVSVDTNGLLGTVTINDDGTLTYTPPHGVYMLDEHFTYTITDAYGATSTATVSVCLRD